MNECARFGPGIAEVALGSQPREALSEHLAQCDACAAEVARQRALVERFELTLGVLAQPEPPEGLVQNVLRQVRAAAPDRVPRAAARGGVRGSGDRREPDPLSRSLPVPAQRERARANRGAHHVALADALVAGKPR